MQYQKINNNPKLCIALDMKTKEENLSLCSKLKENNIKNIYVKIGLRSFIRDGVSLINEIKKMEFKIFLDLKLYDIPNTMLDSIDEIAKIGVDIITIHSSNGRNCMEKIANYVNAMNEKPLIFAVTALTSFSDNEFSEIYKEKINVASLKFSKIAYECGIDGVVCSVLESKAIKKEINILTLTPGIRINSSLDSNDDQKRIASIKDAKECKCDFIVVGRPIYRDKNPIEITKMILEELGN